VHVVVFVLDHSQFFLETCCVWSVLSPVFGVCCHLCFVRDVFGVCCQVFGVCLALCMFVSACVWLSEFLLTCVSELGPPVCLAVCFS